MSPGVDAPGPKRADSKAPATTSAAMPVPATTALTPTMSGRLHNGLVAAAVMASLRTTARIRSCDSTEPAGAAWREEAEEETPHEQRSAGRHELRAESA